MTIEGKKEKFIEAWGQLGTKWGISKTMAHIHALLLFADEHMCADQITEALGISRGNTCMNIKSLVEWELIHGISVPGDRKEYYEAEKDMWTIFTKIIQKRKEQELVPLQDLLEELSSDGLNIDTPEHQKFQNKIGEMKMFANKADGMLTSFVNSENSWLMKGMKMMMR